jgi:hypothetical protein
MLAPAPYQVSAKGCKEESKKAKGDLYSRGAMSGEIETPSSKDKREEETDTLSPDGKKRAASEDLEAKALKRGKMSLSGGSGFEDDVVAQFLRKDKPLAES